MVLSILIVLFLCLFSVFSILFVVNIISPVKTIVAYSGNFVTYSIFVYGELKYENTFNIEKHEDFKFLKVLFFVNNFINMNVTIK